MIAIAMIILAVIICLFILMLFSTISIQLQYSHFQDTDCLKLKALIWRKVPVYKVEVPVIKIDPVKAEVKFETKDESAAGNKDKKEILTKQKMEAHIDKFQKFLYKVNGLYKIINRFLKKVHVKNFRWQTEIGLGDAALTGLMTGFAWSVKGGVIGLIGNKMVFDDKPEISINPLFQVNRSQTNLSCMISFKIGNAILVALQVVKHWKGRN